MLMRRAEETKKREKQPIVNKQTIDGAECNKHQILQRLLRKNEMTVRSLVGVQTQYARPFSKSFSFCNGLLSNENEYRI